MQLFSLWKERERERKRERERERERQKEANKIGFTDIRKLLINISKILEKNS